MNNLSTINSNNKLKVFFIYELYDAVKKKNNIR